MNTDRPYITTIVDTTRTDVCVEGGRPVGRVVREGEYSYRPYRALGANMEGWRLSSCATLDAACRAVWESCEKAWARQAPGARIRHAGDQTCGTYCTDRRCNGLHCVAFGTDPVPQPADFAYPSYEQGAVA